MNRYALLMLLTFNWPPVAVKSRLRKKPQNPPPRPATTSATGALTCSLMSDFALKSQQTNTPPQFLYAYRNDKPISRDED